ncbi:unnamed protein product [Brassica rapa subsp. narinosa]
MATAPTDKDEVQREEVDPAKITEEVNEEAIESSLNQNRQEDSIAIRRSGETMGRGSTSSASQQNRGLVPSGAQMSQQMMMPRPYQQERPVAHFQMPRPYQQEGSVAPFQMSQQMMMSHLRPSVPPYQQERPVAPVQNEFTQPFGMQRGKRKLYEAGESSSSRKRQNQQHLWQIEAPRDSEGYQEYLERLGGSSGGSLGAFSARHPLNQRRQNQPPWMNYTNQPQQQAVRPVMNYNQPQQQAARPWMNYTNQPQQQAVRPAMNYTNQPQQQAVRPWINYNNQPQQQGVRNYNNQPPWMN